MYEDPIVRSEWFDNSAHDYEHIEVRPYASSMGAEIVGLDVRGMSDVVLAELEDALFRHKMIFLRNQDLSHDEQAAFTRRLGPLGADAYGGQAQSNPHVTTMIKEADERTPFIFGGGWHSDSPFLAQPPAITVLRSVETPPYGGDTMWANAALAYSALTEPMKAMLAPLRIHMSAEAVLQRVARHQRVDRGYRSEGVEKQAMDGVYHPLVRTHPRTGEKSLYLAGGYSCGIEGMTEAEGGALIDFLMRHIIQHHFTCRLRWEPNMLTLWDNRTCLHLAMNDHDGFRREMYRSMVLGEVPA